MDLSDFFWFRHTEERQIRLSAKPNGISTGILSIKLYTQFIIGCQYILLRKLSSCQLTEWVHVCKVNASYTLFTTRSVDDYIQSIPEFWANISIELGLTTA